MSKPLPLRPDLEQLKKQAKELVKSHKAGSLEALQRIQENHPGFSAASKAGKFSLSDAQLVLAREYGFTGWSRLKEHVESILLETKNPLELLKKAFHASDAALFRKLLDRHPEFKARINEPIGPFDSPAITHVRTREMLDVLLEAGADIDAKSRWWAGGFGLLHGAEPELAAYAIQRGATVDVHAASRLGMIDKLKELVSTNPDLVHARGGDGQTPLHFASTVEIACFLLDRGADIDARDIDHESTPAQWMIRDRQEIVRHLVQRGCKTDVLMASALGDAELVRKHLNADPACIHMRVTAEYFPKINPKSGGTIYQWTLGWYVSPHDIARGFGHHRIVELLMEHSPADVKLISACWANDESAVHRVLTQNPQLVAHLSEGYKRHVAHAARNNNLAAVRLMLASGLPIDARGQHQGTALHWAGFHGNLEMAEAILRYHPPLELKDADFDATPLGWAIHGSEHGWYCETGNHAATVEVLLKAGASPPEKIGGTDAVQEVLRHYARHCPDTNTRARRSPQSKSEPVE
jgi:ankyrin repeat protein